MAGDSKKVIYAALIGNSLIAVTKFVASAITGSSAMLSEGIHSLVDTGNQVLLLHGLRAAKQPADERFPFGHGKEIYFWSFVVAILIFAVGSGVSIYEGIKHIQGYKIVITPNSVNVRNELCNYVWHDKKGETPVDDFNHAMDALRYAVMDNVGRVEAFIL